MTRFITHEEYRGNIGLSSGLRMVSPLSLEPVFASTAFYVGFGPSAAVFGVTRADKAGFGHINPANRGACLNPSLGKDTYEHPTAEWTARQIVEAFPFETAPKYLLRDRDRIYGDAFRKQGAVMNIKEVLGAPRSPWQSAYAERVIGSIRRECLDHVIVLDEEGLRRVLTSYFSYYHRSRLHLCLDKDSPDSRPVQSVGKIVAIPEVGGLHHRYERRVA